MKLNEMCERTLNRMVADLKREGIDLNYSVQAYASKRGMNATVQLTVRPVAQLPLYWLVCSECQKEALVPLGEWRNTPGIQGVRPTEQGTAGELEATKSHLKDMRNLVASALEVPELRSSR